MLPGVHDVRLTHPDKLLFPDDGISKADLADHYARVADVLLPHVRDRPLSLQVFPGGIGRPGHFMKNVPDYFPDVGAADGARPSAAGPSRTAGRPTRTRCAMLVQHNAITLHVPTARIDRPDRPDRLVVDFDPAGEGQWDDIVAAPGSPARCCATPAWSRS